MVNTRSQMHERERIMAQMDANDMIREKARQITNRRSTIIPNKSPSKRSQQKQYRKSKRESMKFEKLLSTTKENLSKVSDRILPNRPVQPITLARRLFDEVIQAKQHLNPVITAETTSVIIIDDSTDDE